MADLRTVLAAVLGIGLGLVLIAFPAAVIRVQTVGRLPHDRGSEYGQGSEPPERWLVVVRGVGGRGAGVDRREMSSGDTQRRRTADRRQFEVCLHPWRRQRAVSRSRGILVVLAAIGREPWSGSFRTPSILSPLRITFVRCSPLKWI
jgi:hypothetical protein